MPKSSSLKDNSIVIHPTSIQLQIGRSTDLEPIIIPHCIARKRKNNQINRQNIIPKNKISSTISGKFNNAIKLASIAMKSSTIDQLLPFRDQPPLNEILQYNKEHQKIKCNSDIDYIHVHYDADYYVGENACKIPEVCNYNLYWPFINGKLADNYSVSAALQDLEDIWCTSIEKQLKINKSDFNNYNIILVLNDIIIRREIRWIVDMILTKLKFNSIILQQENVCITYSSGISTACVVSIHESSITISCIEEGVSIQEGRIKLLYGIGDILCLYQHLIQRIGVLPKDQVTLDYTKYTDVEFLWHLYAKSCIQQPEQNNSKLISIQQIRQIINNHDKSAINELFEFVLSSEHIISGLSLFYPTLIAKEGVKFQLQNITTEESEPDDPFDDFYLSLTSRDKKKQRLEESGYIDDYDEDEPKNTKAAQIAHLIQESPGTKLTHMDPTRPISLNDAIVKSIHRSLLSPTVSSEDLIELAKQFSTIIIAGVGSGFAHSTYTPIGAPPYFPGFADWLRQCLQDGLSRCGDVSVIYEEEDENESIIYPESSSDMLNQIDDQDSQQNRTKKKVQIPSSNHPYTAAWRGAAMIPLAGSADDVLISVKDWKKYGSRAIREKAPFLW